MTYSSLKLRVSSMKIDGWRQDPFGGGHFLFKYKLIVSGKLLLTKLTFGDMFAHFSACPWVFSYSTRGRFIQLTRDSTPQRLSWGRWWEFLLIVLPFCRSWEVTCQVKHHITSLTLTQSFLKRTSSKRWQRSRTHTQTAFKDYFFRTPYMCFPHTYHPFLLPTKKNTIYANWYICFKQRTKQKVKKKHISMGSFVGCFEKKTPAKRLRLTFHNRIRTERFGECGARPWGSPMCGEGCQVVGWTFSC